MSTATKQPARVVQLREVTTSPNAVVDRENHVIRGVRVLGPSSLNGRVYKQDAIKQAARMYEGATVNVDHPQGSGETRSVADRFGWLEGVVYKDNGLSGDLYYLESDPRAAKVCEAAERKPELFGLSHNVRGRTRYDEATDMTVVEEITRVVSVDVVSDPATTKSLFESQGKIMEDELMAPSDTATPAPGEAIKWGFQDAVVAVLNGDEDKKTKLTKIKALLDAEEKAEAALNGKSEDPPTPPADGEEKETEESRKEVASELARLREENRRMKAESEVRKMLEDAGRKPEPVLVKALMALPTNDDRQELIESWPKDTVLRPRTLTPKRQQQEDADAPKDPKSWAKSVV